MRRLIFALLVVGLLCLPVAAQEEAPAATPEAQPPAQQLKTAQPLELISPIDKGPVKGWDVAAFSTAGVDTDFCYLGASKTYYEKLIATDPRSGYTGFAADFYPNLSQPLPKKVVEKVREDLPDDFNLKNLEPWDRYEIQALIYKWRGKSNKDIANAYLRATYTMRGLALGEKEVQRELKLRKQAIKYFRKAMNKAEFALPELPQLKYLIGDLYRRNGKFRAAIRFFDDAAKMRNRPEWLDEKIIRQKARAYAYDDR
jgi:tetratricopeptide (TPR) repeat protein